MVTYSALFSSGLLAPRVSGSTTTPVLSADPADCQRNPTPIPVGQTGLCTKAPEARANAERPPMRRRRSSINIGTNPMAFIKSPVRNAGAALQRIGFMSPKRHRAGSVGVNEASENNSLLGRLRSGSVGTNPPKRLRRVHRPVPRAPPPSAPLPALPACSPILKRGGLLLPPAIPGPLLQQSAMVGSPGVGDTGNLFLSTSPSTLSGSDYTATMPLQLCVSGSRGDTIDSVMAEN